MCLLALLGLITGVDLRSNENNLAHHTREIDRERLIVRRGQPFSIALQCSDSLPPEHYLELVLHLGEYGQDTVGVNDFLFYSDATLQKQPVVYTDGCAN